MHHVRDHIDLTQPRVVAAKGSLCTVNQLNKFFLTSTVMLFYV